MTIGLDGGTPPNQICGTPKAQNSQYITPTATLSPTPTPNWLRRVIINEVAWGGTQADGSAGQWIELYNPDPVNSVDITGWHLIAADGVPDIPLTGSIGPDGYYLLARRSDVFTGLPVDQVFTDALSATGESLRLVSPTGELVDTANADGGPWPSGSGFLPYASMERNGDLNETDLSWVTFAGTPSVYDRGGNPVNGTPGSKNWGDGMIPTSTPTPTNTNTATATGTATATATRTITPTPTTTSTPAASMSVIINEVAWMGTLADSTDEWIELYNPSATTAYNLNGWKLTKDGVDFVYLSGVIPAGQYFLLARSSTAFQDVTVDQTFTGTLLNNPSSNVLRLYDSSGTVLIDSANANGGTWPAGKGSPDYCSMERSGPTAQDSDLAWFTNKNILKNGHDRNGNAICGTPKNVNWAYYVTITPTPAKTSTPIPGSTKIRTATPTPNRATPQPVVLNEFLPHPRADYNGDGVINSGDEFIELINVSTQSFSLSNWQLDDQEGDSKPYRIGSLTIEANSKMVFYASDTGILLSNGGDSVRLFKSSGQIADAFTYGVVQASDQSWCRLPDGSPTWVFGCEPSPLLPNKLASTALVGAEELPRICLSAKLPLGIYLAECDHIGLSAWSALKQFFPMLPFYLQENGEWFVIE